MKYDLLIEGIVIRLIYSGEVPVAPYAAASFLTESREADIVLNIDVVKKVDKKPMSHIDVRTSAWEMMKDIQGIFYNIYNKEKLKAVLFITYDYTQGTLEIAEDELHDIIPPLHVMFPVLSGFLMKRNKGFFFHGSFVKIGKKGVILTGESGAGKSTLSDLLKSSGFEKIGDDRLILTLDVQEKSVLCHSTPFDLKLNNWVNMFYKVDAILRLSHSVNDSNCLKKQNMNERIGSLIFMNFLPLFMKDDLAKHFNLCEDILSKILLYDYSFVPDNTSVKYLVDNLFGSI